MKKNSKINAAKILILLSILLIVTIACGDPKTPELVATSDPSSVEEVQPPTAVPLQVYNLGDVIRVGDEVIVVLGWKEVPAGEFVFPEEGNKFVSVELIIVNESTKPVTISPVWQMNLKDSTAQKYPVNWKVPGVQESASVQGELAPGEKVRGKVGFEVPMSVQDLQFTFDSNAFDKGKAIVNLGSSPVMVAAPASIAGETQQQTFQPGAPIALGDTYLTVNSVSYPEGGQFNPPDEGFRYLVVDLTLENKSSAAISISSGLQMFVKDSSSRKYDIDLKAILASGGSLPEGELIPGEKLRGQAAFQVPVNASGFIFVFDAEVWGTGKVFVALP
jgi:Domain of unknown function (DUF4352)